jgi:hypothetical protein
MAVIQSNVRDASAGFVIYAVTLKNPVICLMLDVYMGIVSVTINKCLKTYSNEVDNTAAKLCTMIEGIQQLM